MPNQQDSFTHNYADVNGIRLHYVSRGQGPLIMFVHGFPEFWAAWENQLIEMGKDHQAVALDLRGFNLSSRPADPKQYHISIMVEDLRALAEHLGHKKMVLVAHDWGGGVAWAFAHQHPDYVEKLIILNSPHPAVFARELLENPLQRKASEYMNFFRTPKAEETLSADNYAFLVNALTETGSKWRMRPELIQRYIEAWSQPGALTGGLNYYRAAPLHPATTEEEEKVLRMVAQAPPEMFDVKVPTLVIWGELDEALLVGNLTGLGTYVPDLTIHRIPDGTHWVIHEQPELVNRYIREFVQT